MIHKLISSAAALEHEKKAIEWVQWLVKEEAYFERYLFLLRLQCYDNFFVNNLLILYLSTAILELLHHLVKCCF